MHRVDAVAHADAQRADEDEGQQRVAQQVREGRQRHGESAPARAPSASDEAPVHEHGEHRDPGQHRGDRQQPEQHRRDAVEAGPRVRPGCPAGRPGGRDGCRLLGRVDRSAGSRPSAARSAPRRRAPIRARARRPCRSGRRAAACCGCRRGHRRRCGSVPTCTTSPSIQKPARSTSGSIAAPLPTFSMPVTGRSGVQVDVAADLRAERLRVRHHQRGAGHRGGAAEIRELLGEPQSQVHVAAARVATPADAAQQQPGATGRDRDPARRAEQHDPPGGEPPPGRCGGAQGSADEVAQGAGDDRPAQPDDRQQRQHQQALDHSRPSRRRLHVAPDSVRRPRKSSSSAASAPSVGFW